MLLEAGRSAADGLDDETRSGSLVARIEHMRGEGMLALGPKLGLVLRARLPRAGVAAFFEEHVELSQSHNHRRSLCPLGICELLEERARVLGEIAAVGNKYQAPDAVLTHQLDPLPPFLPATSRIAHLHTPPPPSVRTIA